MQSVSAALLLRAGIAFTFLYAAGASFLEPQNWIGFFPSFLFALGIPSGVLLGAFSLYELFLALWLLRGRKVFAAALLSAATFGGIALFNLGALDVVFRDIGLLFAALALAKFAHAEDVLGQS